MSQWEADTFKNEAATDWIEDLVEEGDMDFIMFSLEIVVDYPAEEKPEPWDCVCALAAAEILAAARGNPPGKLPAIADIWLERWVPIIDEETVVMTRKSLDRIEADSMLKDELAKDGKLEKWLANMADLRRRLELGV